MHAEPEVIAAPVEASQVEMPGRPQELYGELDGVLAAAGELDIVVLQHYIAHRRILNVASVVFRPGHEVLLVYLRLDPPARLRSRPPGVHARLGLRRRTGPVARLHHGRRPAPPALRRNARRAKPVDLPHPQGSREHWRADHQPALRRHIETSWTKDEGLVP
ncbi:hypothetical protein ATKI12_4376 [Kitasatospora sp. Ki12]